MKKHYLLLWSIFGLIALMGCSDDNGLEPSVSFDYELRNYNQVRFMARVENAESIEWDFGDGNASSEDDIIHTYGEEGTYTVTLKATNSEGTASSSRTIEVTRSELTAELTYDKFSKLVYFYNASAFSENAIWYFGNGDTLTGDTVSYTFEEEGNFTVKLRVEGTGNVFDEIEQELIIVETFAQVATLETEFGIINLHLFDRTPIHQANFIELAADGFYDGTHFHRIIPNFMIQGGDPNSRDGDPATDGQGGPGYTLEAEIFQDLKHVFGSLAAARQGNQVNPEKRSSGSQFYIVENPNGTPHLDGEYTVFGQAMDGSQVISDIARQPRDGRDRPVNDIPMQVTVQEMDLGEIKETYDYDAREAI